MQQRTLILTLLLLTGLAGLPSVVFAQGKKLPGTTAPPPPRNPGPTRVVTGPTKVIRETKMVKIGSLSVTTEAGATVVLSPNKPGGKKLQKTADETGAVIFDTPGKGISRLEVSKPDFETRVDQVTIDPSKPNVRKMDLKPVTYKLKIKATGTSGALGDGTIQYSQRGAGSGLRNYCVQVLDPNGEALITSLQRGQYDIKVESQSPEFEPKTIAVSVPQDVVSTDPNADAIKTVAVELENKKSSETFGATAWSDADWTKPADWRIDKGMKVRNTEGVALPANDRFRHYIDFELIANVKLNNDGSAGFVFHAKDNRNYYLLVISGKASKSDEPNTAKLFIVKDGNKNYKSTRDISVFSSVISSDKGFQTRIVGDRTGFLLMFEDADGKLQKAGKLSDDLDTFRIGAVGIGAVANPDFDVRQFQVCTPRCQQ